MKSYLGLVDALCDRLESNALHWRFFEIAFGMLSLMLRPDVRLPTRAARIFVNSLNHVSLTIRKIAYVAVKTLLKQHKRIHPTIEMRYLNPNLVKQFVRLQGPISFSPLPAFKARPELSGARKDNLFLLFDPENLPKTETDWSNAQFVHKLHHGFYEWPRDMRVFVPGQDGLPEDMNDVEAIVFEFFTSDDALDRFVDFISLEEIKGADEFDQNKFVLFKGLFRHFGDSLLTPQFRAHLERLMSDDCESSQRCAAEIVGGLVRGTKHWPFRAAAGMWAWLQPLLRDVLANRISDETLGDWGTAFFKASWARDLRQIHWLAEVLAEEPLVAPGASSLVSASRLFFLQRILVVQGWRAAPALRSLLARISPHLATELQELRQRVGSVVTSVHMADFDFGCDAATTESWRPPKNSDFLAKVAPQLEILKQETDPTAILDMSNDAVMIAARLLETGDPINNRNIFGK